MTILATDRQIMLKTQKAIATAIETIYNMTYRGPTIYAIRVVLEEINTKVAKMIESGVDEE